jgi:hypothetical protein
MLIESIAAKLIMLTVVILNVVMLSVAVPVNEMLFKSNIVKHELWACIIKLFTLVIVVVS